MERFFEMAMFIYIITVVISLGLSTAYASGGMQLHELGLTDSSGNPFDYTGITSQMQQLQTRTREGTYGYDVNASGINILTSLPTTIITGVIAAILTILTLISIIVLMPTLWYNLFTALANIIDPGHGAIFGLTTMLAIVFAVIAYIGMGYLVFKMASLIRGVGG